MSRSAGSGIMAARAMPAGSRRWRTAVEAARAGRDAAAAGALGGACVGFGEAVLVAATAAPTGEYWLFLFAVAAYGSLGAAIGAGLTVAVEATRWRSISTDRRTAFAGGAAMAALLITVGHYHVSQRVLAERPLLSSPTGWIAAALLLAAAALAAWAGLLLVRACHRAAGRPGPTMAAAALAALALLLGIALGPAAHQPPRPEATGTPDRPNVVLIVADTLRADAAEHAAAAGSSGLGRLAADGVVFQQAYAQASWTRPSVASILTSQYPSVHGAVGKSDVLPDAALTLSEALHAEGYWTAGVTTNHNVAPAFNFHQGFDEFAYLQPRYHFGATESATRLAICKGLYRVLRAAHMRFAMPMRVEYYYRDAEAVNRFVHAWIDSGPPQPFFLFVHYMDPHDPYFEMPYNGRAIARPVTPDPPAHQREALHVLYLQGVRYLDEHIGLLFDALQERGLYERSVIAVTADHGEEFHEHGGWWHGTTLYDEQLHVPLVIKRAGEAQRGGRRSDPARSVDIGPTLFAAAGLAPPDPFMGGDLFAGPVREPVYAEEDLEGNRLHAIRAAGWKLITANARNPRRLAPVELYHVDEDPAETRNLAAAEPQRAADLLAELERVRNRYATTPRPVVVGRADPAR